MKRDSQVSLARRKGAQEVVQIGQASDPIEAARGLTAEKRGLMSDWKRLDVRTRGSGRSRWCESGGTVNFFEVVRPESGVQLDTNRLHYSESYTEGHIPSQRPRPSDAHLD